jgi:hypothetical protein
LQERKPFVTNNLISFKIRPQVELELITGRTHQLRGQLQALQRPKQQTESQETPFETDTTDSESYSDRNNIKSGSSDSVTSSLTSISRSSTSHPFVPTNIHIAGDNVYTGATSPPSSSSFTRSPFLALQSYMLEFDDFDPNSDGVNRVLDSEQSQKTKKKPNAKKVQKTRDKQKEKKRLLREMAAVGGSRFSSASFSTTSGCDSASSSDSDTASAKQRQQSIEVIDGVCHFTTATAIDAEDDADSGAASPPSRTCVQLEKPFWAPLSRLLRGK